MASILKENKAKLQPCVVSDRRTSSLLKLAKIHLLIVLNPVVYDMTCFALAFATQTVSKLGDSIL